LTLQFDPLWFAKSSPPLTYIGEPNESIRFFTQELLFLEVSKVSFFFFVLVMGQSNRLIAKNKKTKKREAPLI
jgi:hypothetical protein